MASQERNDRSTSQLSLWRRTIGGDEASAAVIFSGAFDDCCTRWHARYFNTCSFAASDLKAETKAFFRARDWRILRQWDGGSSLQHYLEEGILEICHCQVRRFGLFEPLWQYEQDWTLRDRVMTGDSKAVDDLRASCQSMVGHFSKEFFPDGSLSSEDLEQELLLHLMTKDCRRLWVWEGRASLTTYLSTIVARLCIGEMRKQKRSLTYRATSIDVEREETALLEPAVKADQLERVILLEKIEELGEERDRIFMRRLLNGKSEQAALEGLVKGKNGYNIKSRAFKRFREISESRGVRRND